MFVTFLSDFGLQDDFVGTCHGVIKRIAPEAQIIDITHGIPPQQILQGALVLARTTAPWRTDCGGMPWLMSMICASGAIRLITPWQVPTKPSLSPKSLRNVMNTQSA